jgi:hypothetical protein
LIGGWQESTTNRALRDVVEATVGQRRLATRAIEAGGMWKATTEPWGSVVALTGLSSNCVQHQRISQTVPCVIPVEFGINPRTLNSPTCFADPTATAHPPATREHERDRLGSVVGNDFHADVHWASSISSAAASRSAARARASAAS